MYIRKITIKIIGVVININSIMHIHEHYENGNTFEHEAVTYGFENGN